MKISFLSKGILVAAALCMVPAALPASPKGAGQGVVTVNPEASPGDAASLLDQIRSEALRVKYNADQLQGLVREGNLISWRHDDYLLEDVRDQVNELNMLLYNLRVDQAEASPVQQEIIARIAPPALELVGATHDALVTLDSNKSHVSMSDLPSLADEIYQEASRVAQTLGG